MKRIFALVCALACLMAHPGFAQGNSTVVASKTVIAGGGAVTGQLCMLQTTGNDVPVSPTAPAQCGSLTGGVLASFPVANPITSATVGLQYRMTITDALGNVMLSLPNVKAVGGMVWDYSGYAMTSTQWAHGIGVPSITCLTGALYREDDQSPPLSSWACVGAPGGMGGWQEGSVSSAVDLCPVQTFDLGAKGNVHGCFMPMYSFQCPAGQVVNHWDGNGIPGCGNPTFTATSSVTGTTATFTNGNFTNLNINGSPAAALWQATVQGNAASAGTLGMSGDGTTGADDSMTDSFYADFSCNGGALPYGFDLGSNFYCQQGHWNALTTGLAYLVRSMTFSGGGFVPQSVSWTVQGRLEFAPGSNGSNYIGVNAAPPKTYDSTGNLSVRVGFSSAGLVLINKNVVTTLLPNAGTTNPIDGQTDSGWTAGGTSAYPGGPAISGWAPPFSPGAWYDVTLAYPNNSTHDLIVSILPQGNLNYSYSFRIPNQTMPSCASPCGNLGVSAGIQNLQLESNNVADEQSQVAYSAGGPRTTTLNIPHRNGYYNMGLELRYPVAHNTWVFVPPAYDRTKRNKWVIQFHGCCNNGQDLQRMNYFNVSDVLYQQGYVLVSIDNSVGPNPWGNASSITDIQNAIAAFAPQLSLDAHPYAMCDSMGCLQMFNAIANGYLHPRAAVAFSPNTSAVWGWGNGSGPDAGVFTSAYSIGGSNTQPIAMGPKPGFTAGFDPMLAPPANLLAVPTRLFCSNADTVVSCPSNGAAYATRLAAYGGDVVWIPTSGDHEDVSNYQGATVTTFFSQY